jgi:hypothetical protein
MTGFFSSFMPYGDAHFEASLPNEDHFKKSPL